MLTEKDALAWLRRVIHKHIASACSTGFRWHHYLGRRTVNRSLGMQVDLLPTVGHVIDQSKDFVLVKANTGTNEFLVLAKELLSALPSVGDLIRVVPYVRRRFDGKPLYEPISIDGTNNVPGGSEDACVSFLPINKAALRSMRLVHLIEEVEYLWADDIRTIAQALIDAGAAQEPVSYHDGDDDHSTVGLRFRIQTGKHEGYLAIDREPGDVYAVLLTDRQSRQTARVSGGVTELASMVLAAVDDGKWRIAQVEVLQPGAARAAVPA